ADGHRNAGGILAPQPQALHRAGPGAGRAGHHLLCRHRGPARTRGPDPSALGPTMSAIPPHPSTDRNLRVLLICVGIVAGMLGLAAAAVPLYNLFCAVTGYSGTTQRSAGNSGGIIDREMAVRFDANVANGLPLRVEPARIETNPMGTISTVVYRATNLTDQPLSTTAGFNVAPQTTGVYFNKIECFCFTEQTIGPNETVEMPVTYFIDPALDENDELHTVHEITLSYTFYRS